MRAAVAERIQAVLARLRATAGVHWVEPRQVRLTCVAKARGGAIVSFSWEAEVRWASGLTATISFNEASAGSDGKSAREIVVTKARA